MGRIHNDNATGLTSVQQLSIANAIEAAENYQREVQRMKNALNPQLHTSKVIAAYSKLSAAQWELEHRLPATN